MSGGSGSRADPVRLGCHPASAVSCMGRNGGERSGICHLRGWGLCTNELARWAPDRSDLALERFGRREVEAPGRGIAPYSHMQFTAVSLPLASHAAAYRSRTLDLPLIAPVFPRSAARLQLARARGCRARLPSCERACVPFSCAPAPCERARPRYLTCSTFVLAFPTFPLCSLVRCRSY